MLHELCILLNLFLPLLSDTLNSACSALACHICLYYAVIYDFGGTDILIIGSGEENP